MSKLAIEVTGISKKYTIDHLKRSNYATFKDALAHMAKKPLQLIGSSYGMEKEIIWALKDVSFEINRGEVVGLVGPNGSGKSTLFKILSRITEPSAGRAVIHGKTASLLEVGTGFHPELTGRENVYFNGAILGMSKPEINRKFDQIVDFSEIAKFIDTPVKYYSSGMRVRLAFAVAAHLDPEVLLIDEVLAVGDVKFKQKSLNKMREIASSGATVVFVSHSMNQVKLICHRGILLEAGQIVLDDKIDKVAARYLKDNPDLAEEDAELLAE